jgi:nucleotide-binding universal stress UspA family protein
MKPILLATDGSPSAEAATHEAIALARAFEAPLIVVTCANTVLPPYAGYYGYAEMASEFRKTEADHVTRILEETRKRAHSAGIECETIALDGLAGDEICHVARERSPRLVVVGAHGWGKIGRLLHGSVSTHVLHHAPCPVLVVVGEEAEADRLEGITATANGASRVSVAGRSLPG